MTETRYCINDGSPFETDDPDEVLCPHCRAQLEELRVEPTRAEKQINPNRGLIRVNGMVFRRVTFGKEPEWGIPDFDLADYNLPQCPECGVGQGEIHGDMCAHEICPYCSHTLISCDCFNAEQRNLSQDYLPPLEEISELDQTALDHLDETHEVTLDEKERKTQKEKYPCEWKPGHIIVDDYEICQVIGKGGFCKVYQVHSNQTRQDYGVKCPYKGQEDLWRVEQEVAALFRLQGQPNILQIHRAHLWQGIPLIFMEYVEGGDLSKWISGEKSDLYTGSQEEILQRILGIAMQTARAISHVHAKQIVHLDIKPQTILLHPNGMAKLGGFGIAKILKEGETSVTGDAYTPAYCSPEQAQGSKLTYKSDIWSWALVVLEMFNEGVAWLSGAVAENSLETYLQHQEDTPAPAMPEQLIVLLRACFQEDPADRPKDMAWILRFLQAIYQDQFGESYPFPGFSQPFGALEWMKEGIWQFELGNYAGAERLFQQVCTYYPENGWGWLNLMFALLNQSKDPAEAVPASTNPAHYEDHPGISIGQIALQLTTIDEIRIDQVNQVVWIHGGNGDIPMGVSYFASNSYQGRNLSKFMLEKTFPQMKWRYSRIRNNIFWEAKLGSQENETLATIPSSATVAFEDKFSIKCIQCGKDITQFANSDGRAVEFLDDVIYWCSDCAWRQFPFQAYRSNDMGFVEYQGLGGGFALSHIGHHTVTGRVAVIRRVYFWRDQEENAENLLADYAQLTRIVHPNCTRIIQTATSGRGVLVASAYLQEATFNEMVSNNSGGMLTCQAAVIVGLKLLDGLEQIHTLGYTHANLHPGNILFKDGDFSKPKICLADFSPNYVYSFKCYDPERDSPIVNSASLPFLVPELILGTSQRDPAWDLYSLGQVLYLLLTGTVSLEVPKNLNPRDWNGLFEALLENEPLSLQERKPTIPTRLADLIDRAVKKHPQERFNSLAEFRHALQQVLEE